MVKTRGCCRFSHPPSEVWGPMNLEYRAVKSDQGSFPLDPHGSTLDGQALFSTLEAIIAHSCSSYGVVQSHGGTYSPSSNSHDFYRETNPNSSATPTCRGPQAMNRQFIADGLIMPLGAGVFGLGQLVPASHRGGPEREAPRWYSLWALNDLIDRFRIFQLAISPILPRAFIMGRVMTCYDPATMIQRSHF